MSLIDIVIINYNTRAHLQACLDSIDRGAANQVVVVDNNSSDGSVEMTQSRYPWVTLLPNKNNSGYGAAANQGMAACSAPYAVLLNSDTLLQPSALEALSRYLDQHPQAAIVGPRLVEPDGTLQASCYPFPSPLDTFLENSTSAILLGRFIRRHVPLLRSMYLRTWPHNAPRIVPWIKGAALAIRRRAFDAVGGFDESFFMYFEDADLCYRLGKVGWEVHFTPVTTVVHVGGASTEQVRSDMKAQLFHSTSLFYRRHNSRLYVALTGMILKSFMLVDWMGGMFRLALAHDLAKDVAVSDRGVAHKALAVKKREPAARHPQRLHRHSR